MSARESEFLRPAWRPPARDRTPQPRGEPVFCKTLEELLAILAADKTAMDARMVNPSSVIYMGPLTREEAHQMWPELFQELFQE